MVVTAALVGEEVQDEEDLHATAIAAYIVLLAAHARGYAGYWRTPACSARPRAVAQLASSLTNMCSGSSILGPPRQPSAPPARDGPDAYVSYLD